MDVTVLDPDSEQDLSDAASLMTSYLREVLGDDEPATPPEEIRAWLHLGRDDLDVTMLIARDGARAVGVSHLEIWIGHGNEHMAYMDDLYVRPDDRRRGIGRALLNENVDLGRTAERSILYSNIPEGSVDGEGFADAYGMRLSNADKQNRVDVPALDRALLDAWNVAAPGYSLVTFDGACPEDLIDDFVAIQQVMNDAPRPESLDEFVHTAEHRRAWERDTLSTGAEYWFAGARHDATGAMAGFTELLHLPYKPWHVQQEDTGVHPDHRGHGIGRWLKAVNALRVLDEKPEAQRIETWNDGTNRWMLAINTEMGFRPVATWIGTELDI